MTTATELTYAQCVDRLHAARDAAAVLPSVLWQATGTELAHGLEALGELSAVGEGAEIATTIDAPDRGEPAAANPPRQPAGVGHPAPPQRPRRRQPRRPRR